VILFSEWFSNLQLSILPGRAMADDYQNALEGLPVTNPDSPGARLGREERERIAARENPFAYTIESGLTALNDQRARANLVATPGGASNSTRAGLGALALLALVLFVLRVVWDIFAGIVNNIDLVLSIGAGGAIGAGFTYAAWYKRERLPNWPRLSRLAGGLLLVVSVGLGCVAAFWLTIVYVRNIGYPLPGLRYSEALFSNAYISQNLPSKLERVDGFIALSGALTVATGVGLWAFWRRREVDAVGPGELVWKAQHWIMASIVVIALIGWGYLGFARNQVVQEIAEKARAVHQTKQAAVRVAQQAAEKTLQEGRSVAPALENVFRDIIAVMLDAQTVSHFCSAVKDEGRCERSETQVDFKLPERFEKSIRYKRKWRAGADYDVGEPMHLWLSLRLSRTPESLDIASLKASDFGFILR
jgi:hypothetical protein